jgi:hypothetical protein
VHQKKQYEAKRKNGVKSFIFEVGDDVLRRNMVKQGRKGSRLEADWLGPYKISQLHKKGVATLTKDGKELRSKVNCKQLKPYKRRLGRFVLVNLHVRLQK